MSKTCPNCGVNSPDNAKFCIECAESLEGVPINKEEKVKKTPSNSSSDDGGSLIPCIIGIIIVVIIVVAAAAFIFNSGGGEDTQKNVTVTFSDVYVSSGTSISGVFNYYYYVNGFFSNFPEDMEGYAVKTLYCDKNDKELVSTTEKLSYFESSKDSKYDTLISSYTTPNYLDVDHVTVQIIKDGVVLNEYKFNMNTNKLTQGSTSTTNNSSK